MVRFTKEAMVIPELGAKTQRGATKKLQTYRNINRLKPNPLTRDRDMTIL
jgi:hypothetical protein